MIATNYNRVLQFKALLRSNQELLQQKNSYDPVSLLELIKADHRKVLLALTEVKSRRVRALLQTFFAGHDTLLDMIYSVVELERLFHVGFEIYEPMDLVVAGFDHWSLRFERLLNTQIRVVRSLRFPASAAFQNRVKASAEVMRIWMWVNGHELMLELFDIHRPAQHVPALIHGQFNALDLRNRLIAPGLAPDHDLVLQHHFGNDFIWHYAIAVHEMRSVEMLHSAFERFVGRHKGFQLAYPACVYNRHDGSYHTKIIHPLKHLELEFVNHASFTD